MIVSALKVERIKRGIKAIRLAKMTGINPSQISRIENRWVEAKEEEKEAIAKAMKVPVSVLFSESKSTGPVPAARR